MSLSYYISFVCATFIFQTRPRVENGESPILIWNAGNPDLLLFGWKDYLSRFPTLHTPEEIAEIEAACFEMKEMEAE